MGILEGFAAAADEAEQLAAEYRGQADRCEENRRKRDVPRPPPKQAATRAGYSIFDARPAGSYLWDPVTQRWYPIG